MSDEETTMEAEASTTEETQNEFGFGELDGLGDEVAIPDTDESNDADDKNSRDDGSKDAFSDDLMEKASKYGFSPEDVKSFGKPEALTAAIATIEKKLADVGERQKNETTDTDTTEKDAAALLKEIEDLNTEEFDEKLAKTINTMKQNLVGLVETNKQLMEDRQRRDYEQTLTQIDGLFDGLGDTYADLFGKDKPSKLADNSPERKNVSKVLGYFDSLQQLAKQDGESLSEKELLERAMLAAFPEKVKTIARKEIESKVKKRSDSKIPRPNASTDKQELKPGPELAKRNLIDRLRKMGIDGLEEEDDE